MLGDRDSMFYRHISGKRFYSSPPKSMRGTLTTSFSRRCVRWMSARLLALEVSVAACWLQGADLATLICAAATCVSCCCSCSLRSASAWRRCASARRACSSSCLQQRHHAQPPLQTSRDLDSRCITAVENGGRFLTPLVCAGCLLTGWTAAERRRTPPDLPERAVFHPVSRRPAQTSSVRKRLPFSRCIRPEVTPPV